MSKTRKTLKNYLNNLPSFMLRIHSYFEIIFCSSCSFSFYQYEMLQSSIWLQKLLFKTISGLLDEIFSLFFCGSIDLIRQWWCRDFFSDMMIWKRKYMDFVDMIALDTLQCGLKFFLSLSRETHNNISSHRKRDTRRKSMQLMQNIVQCSCRIISTHTMKHPIRKTLDRKMYMRKYPRILQHSKKIIV